MQATGTQKLRLAAAAVLATALWMLAGFGLVQVLGVVVGATISVWTAAAVLLVLLIVLDQRPAASRT